MTELPPYINLSGDYNSSSEGVILGQSKTGFKGSASLTLFDSLGIFDNCEVQIDAKIMALKNNFIITMACSNDLISPIFHFFSPGHVNLFRKLIDKKGRYLRQYIGGNGKMEVKKQIGKTLHLDLSSKKRD